MELIHAASMPYVQDGTVKVFITGGVGLLPLEDVLKQALSLIEEHVDTAQES